MRIVLLGAPGSGKGTQAEFLRKKYHIPHISTSRILNDLIKLQSHFITKVKCFMEKGKLIEDKLVIDLIINRITQNDCYNGFLLDGFPRTIVQAESIKRYKIKIDFVIELMITKKLIIDRITGRRIHLPSGRLYHIKFKPPKYENKDDFTGEELTIRKDDKERVVHERIENFYRQTMPLIQYFHKEANLGHLFYLKIDANRSIIDINEELIKTINSNNG